MAALPRRAARRAASSIVDEAYGDYVDPARGSAASATSRTGAPLVVLRTFSKLFGLAGLRLGYAVADPELARLLDVVQEPFNVNRPALAAGLACLRAPGARSRRAGARPWPRASCSASGCAAAGVEPLPSQSNFVLVHVGGDDVELARDARPSARASLVRPGSDYGLDRLRAHHGRAAAR